jgi:ketosteroid isomerase-like protein
MRVAVLVLSSIALFSSPAMAQTPNAPPPPPPPLPSITLPPQLDRVLRDYERHWRAGDEQALATLFTADGFVPRSGGWVRGSDGIRQTYENFSGDLRLRALAYAVDDTVGYIVGAYRYGEGANDGGKFVLALRRTPGGAWLIAADIDQSNRN